MNRQIKFRAWHERLNRMFSAEQMGKDQLTILPSTGQFINVSSVDPSLSQIASLQEMIPMQFTGLQDRAGNDIYEGDIVKWDDDSKGDYWRFAVVKIDPDIYFDCSEIKQVDGIVNSRRDQFHFAKFIYQDTQHHLSIIGNIYEQPHLLNP